MIESKYVGMFVKARSSIVEANHLEAVAKERLANRKEFFDAEVAFELKKQAEVRKTEHRTYMDAFSMLGIADQYHDFLQEVGL